MKNPQPKERRKPPTAEGKGKRYRCTICRKRSRTKVTAVPYYCPACESHKCDDRHEREELRDQQEKKRWKR
jgi:hypothetical protein